MKSTAVIWTEPVREKLRAFRSEHFTVEETFDYVAQLILEAEDLLLNLILSRSYTEEFGKFKGFSWVVVKNFRIYFQVIEQDIVITAILFPGEQ